jgi:hypothetical protein
VQSEIKTLNEVRGELEKLITRLDDVLYYSKNITVNEFNLLRDAYDSIAYSRDALERLIKQKSK